jgi:hypothetical protein
MQDAPLHRLGAGLRQAQVAQLHAAGADALGPQVGVERLHGLRGETLYGDAADGRDDVLGDRDALVLEGRRAHFVGGDGREPAIQKFGHRDLGGLNGGAAIDLGDPLGQDALGFALRLSSLTGAFVLAGDGVRRELDADAVGGAVRFSILPFIEASLQSSLRPHPQ